MNMKLTVIGIAAIAALASASQAAVLANWTFETSLPATSGPFAAELGVNAASSFASGTTGGTYSNPVGNGSAESYSSNGWNVGEYYQFTTSTTGYDGVLVAFDQVSSGTGPQDFELSYSTDGTTFTSAGAYVVLANASPNNWSSGTPITSTTYTYDLSAITALDNQPTIYLRLINTTTDAASGSGLVAATGTSRVDNVVIAVPEPTTLGLLAGLGVTALRRRGR